MMRAGAMGGLKKTMFPLNPLICPCPPGVGTPHGTMVPGTRRKIDCPARHFVGTSLKMAVLPGVQLYRGRILGVGTPTSSQDPRPLGPTPQLEFTIPTTRTLVRAQLGILIPTPESQFRLRKIPIWHIRTRISLQARQEQKGS